MDEREGGTEQGPLEGRLIRPGAGPLRARLVKAPVTPYSKLLGQALSAASRAPALGLALGGAILLSRLGWTLSLLLIIQSVTGEVAMPLGAALGLGLTATLFATVVELAVWAGGIPVLAQRMRGGEARPFGLHFARGLEGLFATMLGLGLFRVLALLLFQLAGIGFFFAFVITLVASPALAIFASPLLLLFVGGELLFRILAWIAIARAGSLDEGFLSALFAGVRQFFARPMAHLLTWWAANFAISLAGGGVAALVAAGLGAMHTLGAALIAVASSLFVGMVLLAVMAIYTALSLDSAPPRSS